MRILGRKKALPGPYSQKDQINKTLFVVLSLKKERIATSLFLFKFKFGSIIQNLVLSCDNPDFG